MRYQKVMKMGLFGLLIMSLLFLTGCFGAFTDWFAPLPGNVPPTATITAPADGAEFLLGYMITFQGSATDPEDGDLTGDALVWTSNLVAAPIGTGTTFDIDTLPIGTHTITLTATDSQGATGTASITITIVTNLSPIVTITAPVDESTSLPGQMITFTGSAYDPEDGPLTGTDLVWTSNIDGQIGTGVTFNTNTLSAGTHTITLTATDALGAVGTAAITIIVNTPPTATITAPDDGLTFLPGQMIIFTGSAYDPEDGPLTGADLVWTSNIDGQIGTDVSFTRSDLSAGTHTITLTATDALGAQGTASITTIVGIWVDDGFTDATPGWGITRFATITEAIAAASPGDAIFVAAGTYTENVVVNKSITLQGEGRDVVTVTAADPAGPVFYLTAVNVTISGFTVREGAVGIVGESNANTIKGNIITHNMYGIGLHGSTANTIEGNTITHNMFGIGLHGSTANTIEGNTITHNMFGIGLDGSNANTISGNIITHNIQFGIGLGGSNNNTISGNIITDNHTGIHAGSLTSGNVVHSNNIVGNVLGVTNLLGNPLLDATNNWWGHASGPSDAGPGTGDAVSGNVDFDPWEPSPF